MERAVQQKPIMERAIIESDMDYSEEIIQLKVKLAQLEDIVNSMQQPLVWQDLASAEQTV
jgi:hypothetical protein